MNGCYNYQTSGLHLFFRNGQRLVASAQQQIGLEASRARESLRREIGEIAVAAASKLLEREIDARAHQELISKLAAQI